MSVIWTFIWSFLLVHMTTYVVSSMVGVPYDFMVGTILSVGTAVLLLAFSLVLPAPAKAEHH